MKPGPSREEIKPNLFIVGAPKCGTTAWFEYLKTHPDVFVPDVKEPHFFATDLPGMRWPNSLERYLSLFSRAGDYRVIAEASVMYLYSSTAASEIRKFNPNAKIMILLRGQEDFLPSLHHQFLFSYAESIDDFEEAWRLSTNRPADSVPKTCPDPKLLNYAAMGRFHEQVARYFDEFPTEQILVLPFDEWTADPRKTYLKILDFLKIDDDGRTEFPPINEAKFYRYRWPGRLIMHPPLVLEIFVRLLRKLRGRPVLGIANWASNLIATPGYRTKISSEVRRKIQDHYREDNRRLAELIGKSSASSSARKLVSPARRPRPAAQRRH